MQAWGRVSKEIIQNCFQCARISLETQANPVEDNDGPLKSLQPDLDGLKLLDSILVPDGITADDFTDDLAESVAIDDEEILNHYRNLRHL